MPRGPPATIKLRPRSRLLSVWCGLFFSSLCFSELRSPTRPFGLYRDFPMRGAIFTLFCRPSMVSLVFLPPQRPSFSSPFPFQVFGPIRLPLNRVLINLPFQCVCVFDFFPSFFPRQPFIIYRPPLLRPAPVLGGSRGSIFLDSEIQAWLLLIRLFFIDAGGPVPPPCCPRTGLYFFCDPFPRRGSSDRFSAWIGLFFFPA